MSKILRRAAFLSAASLFLAAPAAQAGFEWAPPPRAVAPAAPEAPLSVPAAPAGRVEVMELTPGPLSPVPMEAPAEGESAVEAVVEGLPEAPAEGAAAAVVVVPPVPVEATPSLIAGESTETAIEEQPVPAPMPVVAATPEGFNDTRVAAGFGSGIPLALALAQIVPADYSYSFAKGVSPAMKISWNGGQSWLTVLNEALAPQGLTAMVVGKAVLVTPPVAPPPVAAVEEIMVETPAPEPVASAEPAGLTASSADMGMNDEPLSVGSALAASTETASSYPRRQKPESSSWFGRLFGSDDEEEEAQTAPVMTVPPVTVTNEAPAAEEAETEMVEPMAEAATAPAAGFEESNTPLPPVAAATLDPLEIRYFTAPAGESVRQTISRWSRETGVQMLWTIDSDYTLPNAIEMHATFPDAITKILEIYADQPHRPVAEIHPNAPKGPSVLVIQKRG